MLDLKERRTVNCDCPISSKLLDNGSLSATVLSCSLLWLQEKKRDGSTFTRSKGSFRNNPKKKKKAGLSTRHLCGANPRRNNKIIKYAVTVNVNFLNFASYQLSRGLLTLMRFVFERIPVFLWLLEPRVSSFILDENRRNSSRRGLSKASLTW